MPSFVIESTGEILEEDRVCQRERNIPFILLDSLDGLRIKLTWDNFTWKKSNKSLIIYIHGRDLGKLSRSPKWLNPLP